MRALILLLLCSISFAGPTLRGQRDLTRALGAALGDADEALFILDATPYVRAQTEKIGIALQSVERQGRFRIALLGAKPSASQPVPGALTPELPRLLAVTERPLSTFAALKKTLAGYREKGTVVYFADWHFEDDAKPQAVLAQLKGRGQRFSVIGSEAAFGRGWLDGYSWTGEEEHIDRIGKNPWRPQKGKIQKGKIPWHGGETAYNHLPHRWSGVGWETEFSRGLNLDARPEDLLERIKDLKQQEGGFRRYPLPSAFGPYALSRLCAETGGQYVLWSWNTSGRSSVQYDYSRCELFAPDLRARSAIRKDVAKRPLARALNHAWHLIAEKRANLVRVTPSLGENHATPEAQRPTPRGNSLNFAWPGEPARDEFVSAAERTIDILDRALKALDKPIRKAVTQTDPINRRYLADAHLLQHILQVQRFSLTEAVALARTVPDDAWEEDSYEFPGLRHETYIPAGPEPKALPRKLTDAKAGAELLARRIALLKRYRGTPFGEQIARNKVTVYRVEKIKGLGKPGDGKGNVGSSPAFSKTPRPTQPTAPAGGSSGGSGPTSGG